MIPTPYYDQIREYARRDPDHREPVPGPTYGTVNPGCPAHFANIPISTSPRSRPFRAFANCKPTPPPPFGTLWSNRTNPGPTREAPRWQSSEGALYNLYDSAISEIDDTSSYYPGDSDDGDEDAVLASAHEDHGDDEISENVPSPGIIRAFLNTTLEAAKAEYTRAKCVHTARQKRFLFWADGVYYRLKLRRQALGIRTRLYLEYWLPIILRYLFYMISAVVLYSLCWYLVADWLDDDGVLGIILPLE